MCCKDRGDRSIGERDILVTGPDSYREALMSGCGTVYPEERRTPFPSGTLLGFY